MARNTFMSSLIENIRTKTGRLGLFAFVAVNIARGNFPYWIGAVLMLSSLFARYTQVKEFSGTLIAKLNNNNRGNVGNNNQAQLVIDAETTKLISLIIVRSILDTGILVGIGFMAYYYSQDIATFSAIAFVAAITISGGTNSPFEILERSLAGINTDDEAQPGH